MAVKNIISTLVALALSYDRNRYSKYPTGNKPTFYRESPTVIATDVVSGSLTGGENNKGHYVTLFGYGMGLAANLGTATGARVYFRTNSGPGAWVEVDNYRSLVNSITYPANYIRALTVQLGALGSPAAGASLDLKMVVNGVDSNIITNAFKVQVGRTFYVDSVSGNDATGVPDDITKPFRKVQAGGGTGIWSLTTTAQGDPGIRGGDAIIVRGGTWSDKITGEAVDPWLWHTYHTFAAADGTVGKGAVTIRPYPGPVLGHAPEVVTYTPPSGVVSQGIRGANNASAVLGKGQRLNIVGITFAFPADTGAATDSAPVDLHYGADHWRVMNCDITWPSSLSTSLSGGITGQGLNMMLMFNYVHDIGGGTTNHAFYFPASSGGAETVGATVAYNWVKNVTSGSGIQFYSTGGTGAFSTGHSVHHNYIETCGKYGINFADKTESADAYNNIIKNCQAFGIRFNTGASMTPAFNCLYNTLYNNCLGNNIANGQIENDGTISAGSILVRHNIIMFPAGRTNTGTAAYYANNNGGSDANVTLDRNIYFDGAGVLTSVPVKDTNGVYSNPLFLDTTQFLLGPGSPAIGAATGTDPLSLVTDFYGLARPQGAAKDIGATEALP